MSRTALGSLLAVTILVGCGSNTKTVEIQTHTVTVPVTTTRTQTVTTAQPSASSTGSKCGGRSTACPVVVACPGSTAAQPRGACFGSSGVTGTVTEPIPGPDRTGLGLNCDWSQAVENAPRTDYYYICDTGP